MTHIIFLFIFISVSHASTLYFDGLPITSFTEAQKAISSVVESMEETLRKIDQTQLKIRKLQPLPLKIEGHTVWDCIFIPPYTGDIKILLDKLKRVSQEAEKVKDSLPDPKKSTVLSRVMKMFCQSDLDVYLSAIKEDLIALRPCDLKMSSLLSPDESICFNFWDTSDTRYLPPLLFSDVSKEGNFSRVSTKMNFIFESPSLRDEEERKKTRRVQVKTSHVGLLNTELTSRYQDPYGDPSHLQAAINLAISKHVMRQAIMIPIADTLCPLSFYVSSVVRGGYYRDALIYYVFPPKKTYPNLCLEGSAVMDNLVISELNYLRLRLISYALRLELR